MFDYLYASEHNLGNGKLLEKLTPNFFNVKVIPVAENYSIDKVLKGFVEHAGQVPDPQKDIGMSVPVYFSFSIAYSSTTLCGHMPPEFLDVPSKRMFDFFRDKTLTVSRIFEANF